MSENVKITKDTVIGDVIKMNPKAEKVIEKYFGKGCFTCPGIKIRWSLSPLGPACMVWILRR